VKRGGGQRGRQPPYNKIAHMTRVAKQLQKGVGFKGGFGHANAEQFLLIALILVLDLLRSNRPILVRSPLPRIT